jgi:hypothetical protein
MIAGGARFVHHAGFFFLLDALVDFFAVNRNFLGRVHPDPDLIALYAEHGYLNVVTDVQGLAYASCKDKHLLYSFDLSVTAQSVLFSAAALPLSCTPAPRASRSGSSDRRIVNA